ncbi:MAG: YdcF family protein [Clostridiales bacterium]|nr:YdcF family protein [Clostridiales bacterium]
MAKRARSGCFGLIIKLITTLALLGALAFGVLFGLLIYREHTLPRPGSVDAMIVLGAQVNPDGTPSVQLEWRLTKALEVYQTKRTPIVVTGAQGADEPRTEASVMREWLIARGVPPEDIRMDESSMNTRENIANAMQYLPGVKDVLIVTSDYHLPRAMQIARDQGLNPSGVGSPIKPEYWWKNHFRETLAWGKYYLQKFIPIP